MDSNLDQITAERTLWQIYRASRQIKDSRFNSITTIIISLLLAAYAVTTDESAAALAAKARTIAAMGFTTTLGVLGFLVAGFTVFATVCKPGLLVAMSLRTYKDTSLSYFKYNFFVFMRVFAYYLTYSTLSLLVVLFCDPNGAASQWLPDSTKAILSRSGYVVLGTGLYFLVIQLKSFVFNVYYVVATSVRWEAEKPTPLL